MSKKVALVMVVKNEEKGLEKAILSCKDFVNEIVIAVDTASTDKTLDIAKKYATTLKTFDWRDDFAWARNFAQEDVKSEWILFLDGHEYVSQFSKLEEFLEKDVEGLLVRIKMETGAEFTNTRLYKNGVQFFGRVHEEQNCSKKAIYPYFIIQHDRLGSQEKESADLRNQQREEQIPRILGAEIKQNKKNCRASFHLVLYYLSKNDLKKALKYQKLFLKYSKSSDSRYFMLFSRALVLLSKRKCFRAFHALCEAENENPQRWETEKMKGMVFFESRKYEKALDCLVNSFERNKRLYEYQPIQRDNAGTWNLIGECFFRRGVYSKASTAFEQASDEAKDENQKILFRKRAEIMLKLSSGRAY